MFRGRRSPVALNAIVASALHLNNNNSKVHSMTNGIDGSVRSEMTSSNGHRTASEGDSSISAASSATPDALLGDADDDILSICSSLAQSYSTEWERLFVRPNYLKSLRSYGMQGKLRSSRFRSICWKLFLDVLPEDQSRWSAKTQEWRNRYEDLKNQLIINPRKAEAKDLSINNPLSQEVESPWNQFFLDNELRLTIKQDVVRTFPDLILFRDEYIREIMVDILFCYAKVNERLSYRQGMHELLAPLIFVLHCDQQAFLHACELESIGHFEPWQRELTRETLNHEFLEHDAYALFYQIMETVEPWYVSKEVPLGIKLNSVLNVQPFSRFQDLPSSNVIVTKLTRIQDYLLKRFDNELYEYLLRMDIAPQIYGIRWIRLLFGREFAMQELLMLWDAIFADSISFDLVDYIFVAMLLYLHDAMLSSDYPSCLYLLMKYPPIVDVQHFINHSLHLRDPHEKPRPADLQYQKPNNFGTGSWENSFPRQGTSSRKTVQNQRNSVLKGRRPGSLIIGGKSTIMSKSTSEPMNLITDMSPAEVSPEETGKRKGSSASLSQIEGSLMHPASAHHGLRSNLSTQSLARLETSSARSMEGSCSHLEQMSLTSSDGGNNTSPKKEGRFFMLGNRGGRRQSTKQKQPAKTTEQEIMKALGCLSDMDNLCRRCAVELDLHVGVIQRSLFRRDEVVDDDEMLLALAGIKQVRDVLKGVLKPSSSFGSPEHLLDSDDFPRYKRQSSNSTQSSQSATPQHDRNSGKFYLATPDLLSSDTEFNSPDGVGLLPERMERNPSNDTIVPSKNSRPGSGGGEVVATVGVVESDQTTVGQGGTVSMGNQDQLTHPINTHPRDLGPFERVTPPPELQTVDTKANSAKPKDVESEAKNSMSLGFSEKRREAREPRRYPEPSSASVAGAGRGGGYDTNRNIPASSRQDRPDEQRVKPDQTKDSRRRDGSPIDRLADMFKNFTKF